MLPSSRFLPKTRDASPPRRAGQRNCRECLLPFRRRSMATWPAAKFAWQLWARLFPKLPQTRRKVLAFLLKQRFCFRFWRNKLLRVTSINKLKKVSEKSAVGASFTNWSFSVPSSSVERDRRGRDPRRPRTTAASRSHPAAQGWVRVPYMGSMGAAQGGESSQSDEATDACQGREMAGRCREIPKLSTCRVGHGSPSKSLPKAFHKHVLCFLDLLTLQGSTHMSKGKEEAGRRRLE